MQLAQQLPPGSGVIVHAAKQQVPLHVSCTCGLMQLTRQLLQQPGATLDVVDGGGNTVLHCAAMCNASVGLDLVKMLINEMGANVCAKNYQNQTPYDVATLNNIRQYLLPLQLQQETKEAIANGGTGLPPGIDMGGLHISNNHHHHSAMPPSYGGAPAAAVASSPPPPQVTSPPPQVGPPPQGMPGAQPAQGMVTSPYPQPPNPFASNTTTTTTTPAATSGGSPYPPPPFPGATAAATAPMMQQPQPPVNPVPATPPAPVPSASPAAPMNNNTLTNPPPAPVSGGSGDKHDYALTGYSSAAIYKRAPGSGGMIRPDGFHSSSSDKVRNTFDYYYLLLLSSLWLAPQMKSPTGLFFDSNDSLIFIFFC